MHLEIVSPEATLFSGEATSVTVPGTDGEFQILNNHAAIVSLLDKGTVKIKSTSSMDESFQDKFKKGKETGEWTLDIQSGTIEMKDNKAIVLVD
ncbi:MAG: hypothetical protein CL868_12200 [Cytophagaceae bacterium]|nr:hypothetical protein [Cytophagaceae bacterium]|tara:strand:- start:3992 stop:4273 length:282 start_codon:yes stop_codon:yes gene_type:complete